MTATLILTLTNTSLKGHRWTVRGPGKKMLGRAVDCDIHLSGTYEFMTVSRHHCLLIIDPPAVQVCDLGSSNGTFVNGMAAGPCEVEPVGDAGIPDGGAWRALEDGHELQVGSVFLRVTIPNAACADGSPSVAGQGC